MFAHFPWQCSHDCVSGLICMISLVTFFSCSSLVRVHRRVHQEDKPHRCAHEGCDKAFKTPAELSRHAFRHTGEKPHKCDQCDKAFIRYDDLKRHYRIHTGVAICCCIICFVHIVQCTVGYITGFKVWRFYYTPFKLPLWKWILPRQWITGHIVNKRNKLYRAGS